ncbi:MAG: hypothetical protein U9R08_06145 [Nanoarchaeota archaeon]|nr:hypothetical protein [Nanoarchaeota archaeon]
MDKRGFITSFADLVKGFVTGLLFGIILTYLVATDIIPTALSICG